MENKETTDKTLTDELKEILFKHIHPNPTDRMMRFYNLVDYSGVYKAMKEYALLHLTKQAEVIADSVRGTSHEYQRKFILQASEEYKQTIN
jgi:hypothetical protein